MKRQEQFRWLVLLMCLLIGGALPVAAQEVDDLQEYLDKLAAEQAAQPVKKAPKKGASVEIPVGLSEVDLSKFTSYKNRTKTVTLKASVKFVNGTISAAPAYAGGTCLLKVYGGATVVLGESAGIDASAAASSSCLAAVGIYEGSTFYECGDITAPDNGTGIAIYIDGANDTFNYVSGTLTGTISNNNGGTVNGLSTTTYTKEELQELLNAIATQQSTWQTSYDQASNQYTPLYAYIPNDLKTQIEAKLAELKGMIDQLVGQRTALSTQLQAAAEKDYAALYDQIVALRDTCNTFQSSLSTALNNLAETVKAQAATDLQAKFTALGNEVAALSNVISGSDASLATMKSQIGTYYFTVKSTAEFDTQWSAARTATNNYIQELNNFIASYNNVVNTSSFSSVEGAVNVYKSYEQLLTTFVSLQNVVGQNRQSVEQLYAVFNALPINFPDEELAFTIRPKGLQTELQMGYKSNRGFVLTSAGMMQFEQVERATFRLRDMEDNYVVVKGGALAAGTKAEATVWMGQHIGDGSYTIYSYSNQVYLAYSGVTVNSAVTVGQAHAWTITESELDDLQAFLNMLAEEEETGGGDSGLTEKDTLVYVLPDYDPNDPSMPVPTKPYVFPKTPYPIHIVQPGTGCWPIPMPTPGQPRPKDFHPIYIPKGSHVIIDDVTFRDIVGGDHVIYVEGIIEINVTITVIIENWEWFIHVGPGGQVIWRPGGGEGCPRIKNEGTFDFIKGYMGYVENRGTFNHDDGEVLTAKNYQGATYTMKGGYVRNTVVGSTETVFYNYGTFYFYGGIIGGYGDRLIYHGPGATLRIDGGHFDFTYVTKYWIEAHNYFYIRGDYDYAPTVPILLADRVTIRILYNWIYKWNIVFINGRPTPRFPLFWGDGFPLLRDYYSLIGWQLPNYRWRWYLNETENTIEPRDEEVEDEDDLQAYLDWLAEHQGDEAASTEEEPQQLDLGGRTIVITKPVEIPVGVHVVFVNGTFRPSGTWTHDRVFYIPATTTVRFERVVIDFSTVTYYVVNGVPVQRYIFDVYGVVHFATGCVVRGYFDPTWQFTDDRIPGAVVYIDPKARFYLDGGRFDNVIFRVNTVVNIFVTVNIVNNIYFYVPTTCRYEGFRIIQPWGDYTFTLQQLRLLRLIGIDHGFMNGKWTVDVDGDGYAMLLDLKNMGDLNYNGMVELCDLQLLIRQLARMDVPMVRADLNYDGRLTPADIQLMIGRIVGK